MTRLIGHRVSVSGIVSSTFGVRVPPVHEKRTPPATAMALVRRKRRRLSGIGWRSSRVCP